MALDYVALSSNMATTMDNVPTGDDGSYWMDGWKTNFDNYALSGEFSGPGVEMESKQNLLEFVNTLNSPAVADNWADAISNYWVSQTKVDNSGAVSAINDAAKIRDPIQAEIIRLSLIGAPSSNPPYQDIFSFIEAQIETIIWTVTRADSTTYTITIS